MRILKNLNNFLLASFLSWQLY